MESETTIGNLRALSRCAADLGLPNQVRARAALELQESLSRHRLTKKDFEERDNDWRRFSPPPLTQPERELALKIASLLLWQSPVKSIGEGDVLEIEANPEQWAQIESCWTHHLPQLRQNWNAAVLPEEERLQAEITRLQKELELLPTVGLRAFFTAASLGHEGCEDEDTDWSANDPESWMAENSVEDFEPLLPEEEVPPMPDWLLPAALLSRRMTVAPWRRAAAGEALQPVPPS